MGIWRYRWYLQVTQVVRKKNLLGECPLHVGLCVVDEVSALCLWDCILLNEGKR